MQDFMPVVAEFIEPFRKRKNVVASLVCGSYVTGRPSPRSDLDVVIVLSPGTRHRERGNRIVRGYLVEYFANTPEQFRAYFEREHARNGRSTATMFATGQPLFERRDALRRLRAEALRWLARPLPKLARAEVAAEKYFLWDRLDNLRDLFEREKPGFVHAYHAHVQDTYATYARCLRAPVQHAYQLHAYLSDAGMRSKYRLPPFPDRRFAMLLVAALTARDDRAMLRRAEALTAHALRRLGGFEVDGFTLRTAPSV